MYAEVVAEFRVLENDMLARADTTYAISHLHGDQEPDGGRKSIVLDMHDALEPFTPPPSLARAPKTAPDLWFVGRLDRNKGPDLFVDIVSRVPRDLYRKCYVSGPDAAMADLRMWSDLLKERAAEQGVELSYEGALSTQEVERRAFGACSVVVIPSRSDTFNYVALEALSRGVPILLSEAAGASEFLRDRHPGLPVMTMSPDDVDAAGRTLNDFLQDYPRRLLAFREALAAETWPEPRRNFLNEVYSAPPVASRRTFSGRRRFLDVGMLPAAPAAHRQFDTAEPMLTIIVPTYRRPDWLKRCLAALCTARPRRTRVLVVDDGSPPEMAIAAIAAPYAPFVEIVSIPNGGESNAVNVGLRRAETPYAMVLSDDDMIEPDWPQAALDILEMAPEAVAAYPDWWVIDEAGTCVERHALTACSEERLIGDHWCLPGVGTVFRREVALAVGARNTSYRYVADYDFWLRLQMLGELRHVPRVGGYWRLHPNNATLASERRLAEEHVSVIEQAIALRRAAGRPLAEPLERRARATARLAAGVVMKRSGAPSAHRHFAAALIIDGDTVHHLPRNVAGYRDFYPIWLRLFSRWRTSRQRAT